MEISKDKCTFLLVTTSLLVLAVEYKILSFNELSLSLGAFSFSGVKSNSELFFPIAAFAILIGLCLCHVKHVWLEITEKYHEGYRESPDFVELVRSSIAKEAKTNRYGSCYGGLRPTLKNKQFDLGTFTTDNGKLTKSVIIKPNSIIHVKGCLKGIIRALPFKLWASIYAPFIFAFWALYTIIV